METLEHTHGTGSPFVDTSSPRSIDDSDMDIVSIGEWTGERIDTPPPPFDSLEATRPDTSRSVMSEDWFRRIQPLLDEAPGFPDLDTEPATVTPSLSGCETQSQTTEKNFPASPWPTASSLAAISNLTSRKTKPAACLDPSYPSSSNAPRASISALTRHPSASCRQSSNGTSSGQVISDSHATFDLRPRRASTPFEVIDFGSETHSDTGGLEILDDHLDSDTGPYTVVQSKFSKLSIIAADALVIDQAGDGVQLGSERATNNNRPLDFSPNPRNTNGSNGSRKRYFEDSDTDNNKNDNKRVRGNQVSEPEAGTRNQYRLACPFYKVDPVRHSRCFSIHLSKISYVKQHLERRHSQPIHCVKCLEQFNTHDDLFEHLRVATCVLREYVQPEGVTERQREQLRRRSDQKKSEEEQWYDIFRLLFPDQQTPLSPYLDDDLSEEMNTMKHFQLGRGASIMSKHLQGLISAGTLGLTSENELYQLSATALREIWDEWSRRNSASRGQRQENRATDWVDMSTRPIIRVTIPEEVEEEVDPLSFRYGLSAGFPFPTPPQSITDSHDSQTSRLVPSPMLSPSSAYAHTEASGTSPRMSWSEISAQDCGPQEALKRKASELGSVSGTSPRSAGESPYPDGDATTRTGTK